VAQTISSFFFAPLKIMDSDCGPIPERMGNCLHRPLREFGSKLPEKTVTDISDKWKLPVPLHRDDTVKEHEFGKDFKGIIDTQKLDERIMKTLAVMKGKIVLKEREKDNEWTESFDTLLSHSEKIKKPERDVARRKLELKWRRLWFKAEFANDWPKVPLFDFVQHYSMQFLH
jgi:hypothetical protein